VVNADQVLGPQRVRDGDVLLAMASSGVHSNGYSLVRQVLATSGVELSDLPAELAGQTVGEELLTPTRIYAKDCLRLIAAGGVRAFSHITGGGLAGNLARVLPPTLDALVQRSSWSPPPIFQLLARHGELDRATMEQAFNLGVGMVAVLAPEAEPAARALLTDHDVPCWRLGAIAPGSGHVQLVGDYADCAW
jgi:phosphoribosylformylglycinamidine cyclo-ligase